MDLQTYTEDEKWVGRLEMWALSLSELLPPSATPPLPSPSIPNFLSPHFIFPLTLPCSCMMRSDNIYGVRPSLAAALQMAAGRVL